MKRCCLLLLLLLTAVVMLPVAAEVLQPDDIPVVLDKQFDVTWEITYSNLTGVPLTLELRGKEGTHKLRVDAKLASVGKVKEW